MTATSSLTFADVTDRLAEVLPNYENRVPQRAMAQAIEDTFDTNRGRSRDTAPSHLVVQAGCGVGKSLGYLIPSILSGKRVVIATATKALQDQVVNKDLPFLTEILDEHFGLTFTYALLKGRSNYLCPERARAVDPDEVPGLAEILERAEESRLVEGFTGERECFPIMTHAQWAKVRADADDCQSNHCKDHGTCYAEQARSRAKLAQIVVVNHSVLCSDLQLKEMTGGVANMLDAYEIVVVDEAHELEEYCSSALGKEFSEASMLSMLNTVRNFADKHFEGHAKVLEADAKKVSGAMTILWPLLTKVVAKGASSARLRRANFNEDHEAWEDMVVALLDYADTVQSISLEEAPVDDYAKVAKRLKSLKAQATNTAQRFASIVMDDFSDSVRWVEIERDRSSRFGDRAVIKTAPINVAPWLAKNLFSQTPSILTSATLEVDGSMDFVTGRLGVEGYRGLNVGTPFDFTTQALCYIPADLPDPKTAQAAWSSMSITRMVELIQASDGGALVLFTSFKEMAAAKEVISLRIRKTILVQGEAPNKDLAARFAADTDSVLLATRSFFTGVDFQGDTCRLVIVNKLPFPVPTEPVFEARYDDFVARGGNGFTGMTIPNMVLPLQQAFGRLIRHRDDRGVFALLDPRAVTKGYGRSILRSLPGSPLVKDFDSVASFYGEG